MMSGPGQDYLFDQSTEEAERLRLQARMFSPYTARFLVDWVGVPVVPGCDVLCRVAASGGGGPACRRRPHRGALCRNGRDPFCDP
jgi:hypothetical protein